MMPGVIVAPRKFIILVLGVMSGSKSVYFPNAIIFPLLTATASAVGFKSFMV